MNDIVHNTSYADEVNCEWSNKPKLSVQEEWLKYSEQDDCQNYQKQKEA